MHLAASNGKPVTRRTRSLNWGRYVGLGGAMVLDLPDAQRGDPMNMGSADRPLQAVAAKKRSVLYQVRLPLDLSMNHQ